jgi:predicted Zn-dependent peptidase
VDATYLDTLPNGVRVLTLELPHARSATVAAYLRVGSQHEPRALNGISHVVEHMVFKGTTRRDARAINLDAERLGAEVDAHTDKDHTAYRLHGLPADAPDFVRMLGELVAEPAFPADELARERQVLALEAEEMADDPVATAYELFDRACFGLHPVAQPVAGRKRAPRWERDTLLHWVREHHSGANTIVCAAGPLAHGDIVAAARDAFGALPAGRENRAEPAAYQGDIATRHDGEEGQAHLVLGGALPARGTPGESAALLAAAVFGEGMSSPLLATLREELGLAYHATAAADLLDASGQFVVEASTAGDRLEPAVAAVMRLLHAHASRVDETDFERARRQLALKLLRDDERPARRLEDAVLDLHALGRVRPLAERSAALNAVTRDEVQAVFGRLLAQGLSAAAVGAVGRAGRQRLGKLVRA